MGLQDGTAKFAVLDLRGRGLTIDAYSSRSELIKQLVVQMLFERTSSQVSENMDKAYWRDVLTEAKARIIGEIVIELQKAIDAEEK